MTPAMLLLLIVASAEPKAPVAQSVRVEVFDRDIPERAWPDKLPLAAEEYSEEALTLFHIPHRYTGTGVRADRGNPFLVRATAEVTLPAGKYRLLVRARSAARLSVDGKQVASLPFAKPVSNGHGTLKYDALSLGRTRQVAPGDQEVLATFSATGKPARVVLEIIVGGKIGKDPVRPEPGEALVAFAPQGSDAFHLLAPQRRVLLTDAGWERYAAERADYYDRLERERRRTAFAPHAAYWETRHQLAREYAKDHPIPVPPAVKGMPAFNAVDHFVNASLERVIAAGKAAAGKIAFHRDIQPILQAKCASCHGARPRGGLRLDSRSAILKEGDSGKPAIAPGKPQESELIRRLLSTQKSERMPPKGEALSKTEIERFIRWTKEGAEWPDEAPAEITGPAALTSDLVFLRRAALDVIGTVPTTAEARAFLADNRPDKRSRLIDRLLSDPRHADAWMPYWLDVLAENPNLVNPTLNNTGPFRFFLHEALRDNRAWDLLVTELIGMEGSVLGGGPAGFGIAALNDAPMVAKANHLAGAFLATEMSCARCHDAPYHAVKQADLFSLAAMLARTPLGVPGSSTVPDDKIGRKSLIRVTLRPGTKVAPAWSLPRLIEPTRAAPLPDGSEKDTRQQLAAMITSPANERFAEVMVNRIWRRYFGRGIVEPPHDWETARPSHPELLRWLARQFIASGYDLQHVERLLLNSHAYQRQASDRLDDVRLFAAPQRRRLGPAALADSLHDAFGRTYDTEPLCIDLEGGRQAKNGLNFGVPKRAWQFVSLANERDRPSLNLPRAGAVGELLSAFGWEGGRQEPVTDRRVGPDVAQAAVLANGPAARRLVRLSDDSGLLDLCVQAKSPESLTEELFLRILTRQPTAAEAKTFADLLRPGFAERVVTDKVAPAAPMVRRPYVSWANHLDEAATLLRLQEEAAMRRGPAPTTRLRAEWRERMEDGLWALLCSPEVVIIP